ncbi:hypothetical protein N7373_05520 [Achromobacter mucicolens]|uniref:hypothetical protein n=1 Tax=Achromobacter mucicolens TaxID=1389922 RepID=UPI00244C9E30|nr:hypothetical protein [Achromobacter mucicolens]MDH0090900.1 hypothetical protein [Achromobacter mucicolens]
MKPLLERPVSFRLSADAHQRYEAAAAQVGMRLSQYLRFRLEAEDSVSDQVAQLRLSLLDAGPSPEEAHGSHAVHLEILLLLRRLASPADVRAVHHELKRQHREPWSAD